MSAGAGTPDEGKAPNDDVEFIVEGEDDRYSGDERQRNNDTGDESETAPRPGETEEQRQERTRQTTSERNARRQAGAARDAMVIAALTSQVQELNGKVQSLGGKQLETDVGEAERNRDWWVNRARNIQKLKAKAISDGEGDKVLALEDEFAKARNNANHFEDQRVRVAEAIEEAKKPKEEEGADAITQNNAKVFMKRHPWYDPDKGDAASKKLFELDKLVYDNGLRPNSQQYWSELEKLIKDEMPEYAHGAYKPKAEGDKQPLDDKTFETPRNDKGQFVPAGGGPPVSGRSEGKKGLHVPAELKKALEEAGIWGDKVKTTKAVQDYHRIRADQKK